MLEAVIIAIVLLGSRRLLRDVPYTGDRGVDAVGSVLSVLGMGGLVLGILAWQEGGESVGALLAAGLVAMGALVGPPARQPLASAALLGGWLDTQPSRRPG